MLPEWVVIQPRLREHRSLSALLIALCVTKRDPVARNVAVSTRQSQRPWSTTLNEIIVEPTLKQYEERVGMHEHLFGMPRVPVV